MPAATPVLEDVLAAIKTIMEAIVPTIGTVRTSDTTVEDEVEFLDKLGLLDADSIDLWVVELRDAVEIEGDAAGEKYVLYSIGIRYWSLRTADLEWSKKARQQAAIVQQALSGNSDIFRIGGQVPLQTPETVSIEGHGVRTIGGGEAGPQMLYQTVLGLAVEARRWG